MKKFDILTHERTKLGGFTTVVKLDLVRHSYFVPSSFDAIKQCNPVGRNYNFIVQLDVEIF